VLCRRHGYRFLGMVYPELFTSYPTQRSGVPSGTTLFQALRSGPEDGMPMTADGVLDEMPRYAAAAILSAVNPFVNFPVTVVEVILAIRSAYEAGRLSERYAAQLAQFKEMAAYGRDGRPGRSAVCSAV
jgi:hypothetical protein